MGTQKHGLLGEVFPKSFAEFGMQRKQKVEGTQLMFGTAVAQRHRASADHQQWSRQKQALQGGDSMRHGEMEKKMNAIQMLEEQLGFAVIDSLVQANVDLQTVTLEQVKQMLVQAGRERRENGDGINLHGQ